MNKVITISGTTLAVLSVFFIALGSINLNSGSVHAAETSTDTEVALNVDSVINISAPSTATINCTPGATAAAAELCTTNVTVGVGTNNITGYTLQMNATSGSPTSLTNSATSPAATIPTLSQAYTSANFPTNYWGYTGGTDKSSESGGYNCSTNYCPVLAYQSSDSNYAPNHVIKITNAPTTTSATTITFAGKVNIDKPSGTYTTSVTFTAVTNAPPAQPISNDMYMQDVTQEQVSGTPTDVTYTLKDKRDEKEYTVAKLQDGNLWMTQNLALGETDGDMELTSEDSDVDPYYGFILPASVSEGDWNESYVNPEFFDYADNYPSQQAANKYGNYYNWSAATADSGNNVAFYDTAEYSICPKNWRLPSADQYTTANDEFYTMLNNYVGDATWISYWYNITTSNLTNAPVSLVFPGIYCYDLESQGARSVWWSSTADGSHEALTLDAYDDGFAYPSNGGSRLEGYSIRCLVPGQ